MHSRILKGQFFVSPYASIMSNFIITLSGTIAVEALSDEEVERLMAQQTKTDELYGGDDDDDDDDAVLIDQQTKDEGEPGEADEVVIPRVLIPDVEFIDPVRYSGLTTLLHPDDQVLEPLKRPRDQQEVAAMIVVQV